MVNQTALAALSLGKQLPQYPLDRKLDIDINVYHIFTFFFLL